MTLGIVGVVTLLAIGAAIPVVVVLAVWKWVRYHFNGDLDR
jgi:hypothetical protein